MPYHDLPEAHRRLREELGRRLNVVRGEMELVGPRPVPERLEDLIATHVPSFVERRRVKPGLWKVAAIDVAQDGVDAELVASWTRLAAAETRYIEAKSFRRDVAWFLGRR